MAVKQIRRGGTSIAEFERNFPDSDSCLSYIFRCRFDENVCPKCGEETQFVKIKTANRYIPKCCFDASLYPLRYTMFSATRIPLNSWFRVILYFTNSSTGISPNFVHQQMGISKKAAIRMCQLIREHLTAIDDDTILGKNGETVFVSETTMKSISRKSQKNGVRFRILMATDGTEIIAIPVQSGRYVQSRDLLLDRIAGQAKILTQTAELNRKLLNFRNFASVKGRPIATADDPYLEQFNNLSVFGIALKRFILQSHYWVSEQHLASYAGHFAFLYRRRQRGTQAFWDAISSFPKFGHYG